MISCMFETDNNLSSDLYRFMHGLITYIYINNRGKIIKHVIYINIIHDYTTAGAIFSRPFIYSN